jgi:6,7-dimethyl-8-ribityllumazine synthase
MATAHRPYSEQQADVPNGAGRSFALVVSEWNTEITTALFEGARETLIRHGVPQEAIHRIDVPGSFELVYGAQLAQQQNVDAVIAIGSVIQGETRHFDFVCSGVAHGIQTLNASGACPVIFCVLTDNTLQQAKDRSGGKYGNKGEEAAIAALKMADLRAQHSSK